MHTLPETACPAPADVATSSGETPMSSAVSKILPMAGFGLLGLLPAMAGTWLWTRHGVEAEAAKARRDAQAGEAVMRLSAGNLSATLQFQNAVRDAELKTATAFLSSRQQAESGKNAGENERLAAEKKAADEVEETLTVMAARMPAYSAEAGFLKDEARTAAKLADATWPALKTTAEALQTRLSAPVQQKDLPALESDVKGFEQKLAPGVLPEPQEWEQEAKSLLEDWHRKVTGA
ncbi:MAG: hypothetical protein JWO82_929 [Akkermansiaceae bacterium]|nr:hypothetical protein [Akkermansiaceae bacterium]